ncbi:hypothetical protein K488DRAFT_90819 [Vararia minispora EC-137]|uniref:Uncharacterized protein n=1 Tax=Vararia minispora EC-137 TaxID=1314806 RepID=A0ACB8Q6U1_9AGAM|nr:hypothetical protein K488DRAFT_90819 [Vararia minispora EC-137]
MGMGHIVWVFNRGLIGQTASGLVVVRARTLALSLVILAFIGFNTTSVINCEVWFRLTLAVSYGAASCCALLIGLRAVALWGRTGKVFAWVGTIWLANFGVCIYNITRADTVWYPSYKSCMIWNTSDFKTGLLINLISNTLLLGTMFVGVWRKKNTTELWHVLYVQGIMWTAFAMASEIPTVVLSWLNLSDGWNLLFQTPHVILFVIVCTRMHRDLSQYIAGDISQRPAYLQGWKVESNVPMHVAVHRTVHVAVDEHQQEHVASGAAPHKSRNLSRASTILESVSPADAKDMELVL